MRDIDCFGIPVFFVADFRFTEKKGIIKECTRLIIHVITGATSMAVTNSLFLKQKIIIIFLGSSGWS
jgi:hypothetical protein